MQIKIRELRPNDMSFVLSSWIKSFYAGGTGYKEARSVFHKGMESIIRRNISAKNFIVLIACLEEDEDAIFGYAAFGLDYTLHYVFVKDIYRKVGIAKRLLRHMLKDKKEITVSHWTQDMKIIKKMYNVTYNRFKFYI